MPRRKNFSSASPSLTYRIWMPCWNGQPAIPPPVAPRSRFVRCWVGVVSQTLAPRGKEKMFANTSARALAADAQNTTSTTLEHFAQELFRKSVWGANPQIDLVITITSSHE